MILGWGGRDPAGTISPRRTTKAPDPYPDHFVQEAQGVANSIRGPDGSVRRVAVRVTSRSTDPEPLAG